MLLASLAGLALSVQTNANEFTAFWNFGTSTAVATPDITQGAPFNISAIGHGNTTGSTTSHFDINNTSANNSVTPSGSFNFSRDNNAGLRVEIGGFDTSTSSYFKWTLTPDNSGVPITLELNEIYFVGRRAGTGPRGWRLMAFGSDFTHDIASGSIPSDSLWYQFPHTTNIVFTTDSPVEFRLYGYDGTATSPNNLLWRIDDVKLVFSDSNIVPPVPVLTPPVLTTTAAGSYSVTVGWDPVALATGYFFDASASPAFSVPGDILHYASVATTSDLNGWVSTTTTGTSGMVLTSGNSAVSPWVGLTNITDASFSFTARAYGNYSANLHLVRVEITTNGTDWATVGEITPLNGDFNPFAMSLSQWIGNVVKIRMTAPNSNGNQGAGIRAVCFTESSPNFLPGYENLFVGSGTSVSVTGLSPETTYYFRARSTTNGVEATANSATHSETTGSVNIGSVEPLTVQEQTITHESAVLEWNPDSNGNATGYEIVVYKTNNVINIGAPRLIFSKIFFGNANDKAVEILNIGDQAADLNEYTFKRGTSGNPTVMNQTYNLASAGLSGAARYLQPGESFRIVKTGTTVDNTLRAGNFINHAVVDFASGVDAGLFVTDGDVLIDLGRPLTGNVRERAGGISVGAVGFTATDWTQVAYTGTPLPALKTHFVYVPVLPSFTVPNVTDYMLTGLKHETWYWCRVRGVNGGATGPWSGYATFLTLPQPKTTVIIVR